MKRTFMSRVVSKGLGLKARMDLGEEHVGMQTTGVTGDNGAFHTSGVAACWPCRLKI